MVREVDKKHKVQKKMEEKINREMKATLEPI